MFSFMNINIGASANRTELESQAQQLASLFDKGYVVKFHFVHGDYLWLYLFKRSKESMVFDAYGRPVENMSIEDL